MQDDLQLSLIKYNKKTWCKSALLGFFIGLAVIVPGISGSTVAIIFKLYDSMLLALGNLFKAFKRCVIFLLPIGIGAVVGVLLGFLTVQKLLDLIPFAVVGCFAGLMSGAFPAVTDELKGNKLTVKSGFCIFLGVLIPLAIGIISVLSTESGNPFESISVWEILLCLPVGYIVGLTQIVPGLSASAILMSFGWFTPLVNSVHLSYWTANPKIWLVYICLGVGFLTALVTFSKVLTYCFEKSRFLSYSVIVGLSLGSIITMFYNPEIFEVYTSWSQSGVNFLDLGLGIGLFVLGFIGAYLLVRYERKKKEVLQKP